jgi:hypothetical protein
LVELLLLKISKRKMVRGGGGGSGVDWVRWAVCTCGHGGPGEEDARRVGREKKIVNVYFPTDVK